MVKFKVRNSEATLAELSINKTRQALQMYQQSKTKTADIVENIGQTHSAASVLPPASRSIV
jgi:hypothetical protein